MNRADRRAVLKAIRRGHSHVKFLWPKFPSGLLFNLMVRARISEAP